MQFNIWRPQIESLLPRREHPTVRDAHVRKCIRWTVHAQRTYNTLVERSP